MKKTLLKKHRHESNLGTAIFHNVPALLDDDGDELIGSDVIGFMERQVALQFYLDVNHKARALTKDEVYGLMILFKLNQSEMATLLGIHKATVTRIIKGSYELKRPETTICLSALWAELEEPGTVRKVVEAGGFQRFAELVHGGRIKPAEPEYDLRKRTA